MNTSIRTAFVAAILLASVPRALAGPPVDVYGIATTSDSHVILDVFTDTNGYPLRGFGIKVLYDPSALAVDSGGRYDGLWFLRGENGIAYPYTDLTLPESGCVRVVGGRLDGANPGGGVEGSRILLATVVFKRLDSNGPDLRLDFASPDPYVNFASAEGKPLDSIVRFADEIVIQKASEDLDGDGLPDNYETATFGDLTTSDGASDSDGDGDDDSAEWLRGTDPTDPTSRFILQVVPQSDGSKLVIWTGQLGRVYDLEWSTGLDQFEALWVGLPGLSPVLDQIDDLHPGIPQGFFRVITRNPTLGR